MKSAVVPIAGIPQPIYKIPLDNPEVPTLHLQNMFDRLIIGPSAFPLVLQEAFTAELTSLGITDAATRVVISGIPLRQYPSGR